MAVLAVTIPIDFLDATGNAVDISGNTVVLPANSLVTNVEILRTTAWDAITTFEVGKAGDSDWLSNTLQANLTGAAPGVETIAVSRYSNSATTVTVTWAQGGATQGAGSVTIQYITNVFDGGGGGSTGVGIAEPIPWTLLSLYRYAKIMGVNPVHFWSSAGQSVFPINTNACNDVWPRWSWQAADQVSHEGIARAIQSVEQDIANILGYWPAPMWVAQEIRQFPRPYRPDLLRLNVRDVRGFGVPIKTKWGKIIQAGQRAVTLVGTATTAAGTLTYTDEDGDGFAETATITLTTTLTDPDEVKVYIANTGGRQEWEIRQPRQKTITAGTFVAIFNSWLFVNPETMGEYPTTDGFDAIDVTTTANYVTSVDVYREYTDTTAASAVLYWEPIPATTTLIGACCTQCSGSGCSACVLTTQDGCIHIRNPELGLVVPLPAEYDATEAQWNQVTLTECRDPDFVRMYYYAGDISNKSLGSFGTFNEDLSDYWARLIARAATARLERPICQCGNVVALSIHLMEDLTKTGEISHFVDPQLVKKLGPRRGEVELAIALSKDRDRIPPVALA